VALCGAQYRPGGEPLPAAWLDKIESKISALACIGPLERWDRRYRYKAWTEGSIFHLDELAVEFEFYEAGRFEFRPGRRFVIDLPPPLIDDRSYLVAFGEFDLATKRVTLKSCG
jgi:hypothetical protein